jgi:hypothetical protein
MLKAQYRALASQGKAPMLRGERLLRQKMGMSVPSEPSKTAEQNISAISTPKVSNQYVGDIGSSTAESDYTRLLSLEPAQWQPEKAISTKVEEGITQNASSAHNQGNSLAQLSSSLMAMPDQGMLSGGALNNVKTSIIARANDVIRSIGPSIGIDPKDYVIGDVSSDDPMALKAAADKLAGVMQFARASGADQNSLGALETASLVVPKTDLSKNQALQVLASLYVDKQHALDQASYLNEYKNNLAASHPGMGNMYLAQNAQNAFRRDHSDIEYGKAKKALLDVLKRAPDIFSGKVPKEYIDKYGFEKYGIKNLSRFLENY